MSKELKFRNFIAYDIVVSPRKKLYKSALDLEAPATKRLKSKKNCRFVELEMKQVLLDGIWMFNWQNYSYNLKSEKE